MKRRRDLLILLALFLAMVLFVVLGPGQADEQPFTFTPTTYASSPGGALALLRWTQSLGYEARRLEYQEFRLGPDTDTLFILAPTETLNRTATQEVIRWVEDGGTLVVVQESQFGGAGEILRELELRIRPYEPPGANPLGETMERATTLQPILNQPPVESAEVWATSVISTTRDDVAPLLGQPGAPVLVGLSVGNGYVYVSSSVHPFTNTGLLDEGNAAVLLNLLRRVPPGGTILFDEVHHGFVQQVTLRTVIFGNAWGWALVYGLLVLAAFFILTGRRFGKPVPLAEEIARRSSGEYVESMADLFQRGGQRDFVLRHYLQALKRRLARPAGVNPQLDDAAFVSELARNRPLDQNQLGALLNRMRRRGVSEGDLLNLVKEADGVVNNKR